MTRANEEILSAELVLSPQEVLAEFQERCEEAAAMPGIPPPKTDGSDHSALCRMLDRKPGRRKKGKQ